MKVENIELGKTKLPDWHDGCKNEIRPPQLKDGEFSASNASSSIEGILIRIDTGADISLVTPHLIKMIEDRGIVVPKYLHEIKLKNGEIKNFQVASLIVSSTGYNLKKIPTQAIIHSFTDGPAFALGLGLFECIASNFKIDWKRKTHEYEQRK